MFCFVCFSFGPDISKHLKLPVTLKEDRCEIFNKCGEEKIAGTAGWQVGLEKPAFAVAEKRNSSVNPVSQESWTIGVNSEDQTCRQNQHLHLKRAPGGSSGEAGGGICRLTGWSSPDNIPEGPNRGMPL